MPCSAACSSTRIDVDCVGHVHRSRHDDGGELDRDLRLAGYDVIGNAASLPSYATVTPSGEQSYTWAASTTDPAALQTADGTSRIAACWYSDTSFTVDVNLTDGQTHDLELYFLDWDGNNDGSEASRSDQRRRHRDGTEYRDGLVVPVGRLPEVGGQRERADHDHATWPGPMPCSAACSSIRRRRRPVSTVTGIGSSLNSSIYGQTVTFTATVGSTSGGVPTGSVEFYDGTTDLGSGTALTGSGNSATSTFTTSTLAAGTNASITADLHSDWNFGASSGSMSQTVNPRALTITAAGMNKVYDGTTTATVTLSD